MSEDKNLNNNQQPSEDVNNGLDLPSVDDIETVVGDVPVRRLVHKGITIEGYSRAAVQTFWRVPEFKLGFDLGAHPWAFIGTPNWFISHTHIDHVVAIPAYIARRRMMKMTPPNIYLPAENVETLQRLLRQMSRLDHGRLPCNLHGLKPGDEVELSRELIVTATETRHTVPSLGFIVWERRRKLKQEYLGLPGDKIRDLRLSGVEVTYELRIPRVAYLGDSTPEGLDNCPAMYEAQILILELTFVAARHRADRIHKFGHMHLDDLLERKDRFQNEVIIAAHFSTRYHPRQIERYARRAVPDMLGGRLHLWL